MVVVVDGGACVVVVVEVVVVALYNASFLSKFKIHTNYASILLIISFDVLGKIEIGFVTFTASKYLNQYFADDLQFTSDTK